MEELNEIIASTKMGMEESILHLEKEFRNIRAGKASPNMVASVMVDYYGNATPMNQVANVSAPDAMTIAIQPWEKSLIPVIEKAILHANLGFNPSNNGDAIIINVPPLTEERRKDLAKQAKTEAENAKIGVRNWRKDAMNNIKKSETSEDAQANAEIDIQTLTDKYIKQIDDHLTVKEEEIMKI